MATIYVITRLDLTGDVMGMDSATSAENMSDLIGELTDFLWNYQSAAVIEVISEKGFVTEMRDVTNDATELAALKVLEGYYDQDEFTDHIRGNNWVRETDAFSNHQSGSDTRSNQRADRAAGTLSSNQMGL